jgi:nicotinamidase-related amidase
VGEDGVCFLLGEEGAYKGKSAPILPDTIWAAKTVPVEPGSTVLETSMDTLPQNTALIVIDVQEGMDDPVHGRRNNPEAEGNIARLLSAWRRTGRPIVHVQHLSPRPDSPFWPGQPGVEIKDEVRPEGEEPVVQKRVNTAFIGTDLEERLRAQGIETVVVTGMTTDHCVSATTRVAGDLGFRTYVVSDATAAFDREGPDGVMYTAEEIHGVSLATLHQEFATVVDTESVLAMIG